MTFIIEFALLHLLFYMVYLLFLSRETQLAFRRLFLVGSTILSLSIPLIEIPTRSALPTINVGATVLPMVEIGASQSTTSQAHADLGRKANQSPTG